jgi:hypothetical protein
MAGLAAPKLGPHIEALCFTQESAMKGLVGLEAPRERLHGVPEPDRGRF